MYKEIIEKTLDYYNQNAGSFVKETVSVDFRKNQDRFLKALSGNRVLDFGCGSGRDTKYFLDAGLDVTAIDGSERMCNNASVYTGIEVRHVDSIGDARIEEVLDDYIEFYQNRLKRGLPVDRRTCPYDEKMLMDRTAICRNMLTNPFEKFERKRFLYYSKDLSVISMNHVLFSQMKMQDWEQVRSQLQEDLVNYYSDMGGI